MDTILYERSSVTESGSISRQVIETDGNVMRFTDLINDDIVFHQRLTGSEIAMLFILLSEQNTPFQLELCLDTARTKLARFRQKEVELHPDFQQILSSFTREAV